jgi:hypothetical protein
MKEQEGGGRERVAETGRGEEYREEEREREERGGRERGEKERIIRNNSSSSTNISLAIKNEANKYKQFCIAFQQLAIIYLRRTFTSGCV